MSNTHRYTTTNPDDLLATRASSNFEQKGNLGQASRRGVVIGIVVNSTDKALADSYVMGLPVATKAVNTSSSPAGYIVKVEEDAPLLAVTPPPDSPYYRNHLSALNKQFFVKAGANIIKASINDEVMVVFNGPANRGGGYIIQIISSTGDNVTFDAAGGSGVFNKAIGERNVIANNSYSVVPTSNVDSIGASIIQNTLTTSNAIGDGHFEGQVVAELVAENMPDAGKIGNLSINTKQSGLGKAPIAYVVHPNPDFVPLTEILPERPAPDSPLYLNYVKSLISSGYRFTVGQSQIFELATVGDIVSVAFQNIKGKKGGYYIGNVSNSSTVPPSLFHGAPIISYGNAAGIPPGAEGHSYYKLAVRLGMVDKLIVGVGWPPATTRALAEHALWTKPASPPLKAGFYREEDVTKMDHQFIRDALAKYWLAASVGDHLPDSRKKAWKKLSEKFKTLKPDTSKNKESLNDSANKNYWSAAYVSWCLAPGGFLADASHGMYARYNNGKDGRQWKTFSLLGGNHDRIVVQVGDVLLKTKGDRGPGGGHGDFVYKIENNFAYLSGGNIIGDKAGHASKIELKPENNTLKAPETKVLIVKKMS